MITEGTKVRLRPFQAGDLPVLTELRNDEELQRLLLADWKHNSQDDVKAWLKRRASERHTFFAVVADRITDDCCGFIQLLGMKPPHCNGTLGIAVHASARGRGLGAEAIRLASAHAQATYQLRKIVLHVMSGNRPAVRLYERLGFRRVGTLEAHYWNGSDFEDVHVMECHLSSSAATFNTTSQEQAA